MISQVPAGLLVDALRNKRVAVAAEVLAVGVSALLLAAWPALLPVLAAQAAHGFASCVLTPGIAAVSLELVGHAALGERIGRNARFAALGNGLAAGAMGLMGNFVSEQAVFLLTAVLCVPALATLPFIDAKPPPRPRRQAATRRARWTEVVALLTDRRLLMFAACAVLFQMADAAMLPIAAGELTAQEGTHASLIIAACHPGATGCGSAAVTLGGPHRRTARSTADDAAGLGVASAARRAVCVAAEPVSVGRGAVDQRDQRGGIWRDGALVHADDVTLGARRFNLCIGIFGLASTVGGALSTTLAGLLADAAGERVAFLGLAAAGLAGTTLVWLAMPETGAVEDAG